MYLSKQMAAPYMPKVRSQLTVTDEKFILNRAAGVI